MKSKYIISLVLILIVISAFPQTSENPFLQFSEEAKIQQFEHGYINWSEGYFLAKATGQLKQEVKNAPGARFKLEKELEELAKKNLLNIILTTKVDSYRYVKNYFQQSEHFKVLFLEEVNKNINALPPIYLRGNHVEVTVKYPLYGKGSLADLIFRLDDYVESTPKPTEDLSIEPVRFTSVIIDLREQFKFRTEVSEPLEILPSEVNLETHYLSSRIRYDKKEKQLYYKGIMTMEDRDELLTLSNNIFYQDSINELFEKSKKNLKSITYSPSLFPTIYDSHGKVVYNKEMIKTFLRPKLQYAQYTKDNLLMYKIELVGNNPLYIFADKVKGENFSDIIINEEDSNKILLNEKNIDQIFMATQKGNNLEQLINGRIFFLVD